MSKNHGHEEHTGKTAGLVVKNMIQTVEEKMAAGEQVSAGPMSEADAKSLQNTREENQICANRAQNAGQG